MKFCFAAIAACALGSVSAEAFVERQTPTVVGTIDASVSTVNYTVSTYLVTIGMLYWATLRISLPIQSSEILTNDPDVRQHQASP